MKAQIITKLTKIEELSKFKFVLCVTDESESIQISLEPADEDGNSQSVSASDYLYMLEKGSPLWGMLATKPIELTVSVCQTKIHNTLSNCIDLIMNDGSDEQVNALLIDCMHKITNAFNENVDQKLKHHVICKLLKNNKKIS